MIKKLVLKYKTFILYCICGGLAALISILVYFAARKLIPADTKVLNLFYKYSETLIPNIIAWVCAAAFAYVTNRIFVFKSKISGFKENIKQILSFYSARLFTLCTDIFITYVFIDMISLQSDIYEFCIKILSNVVTLILNYIFSKCLVFKSHKA